MINFDVKRAPRVPRQTVSINTSGLVICYLIAGSTMLGTVYAFVRFFVG